MQNMGKKERKETPWSVTEKCVCVLNANYGERKKLESVASLKNIFLKLEYMSNNLIVSVNTTSISVYSHAVF